MLRRAHLWERLCSLEAAELPGWAIRGRIEHSQYPRRSSNLDYLTVEHSPILQTGASNFICLTIPLLPSPLEPLLKDSVRAASTLESLYIMFFNQRKRKYQWLLQSCNLALSSCA